MLQVLLLALCLGHSLAAEEVSADQQLAGNITAQTNVTAPVDSDKNQHRLKEAIRLRCGSAIQSNPCHFPHLSSAAASRSCQ